LWQAWLFQSNRDVETALNQGIGYAKAGELHMAESKLSDVLHMDPDCFVAVQVLTKVQLLQGNIPEAWTLFQRAFRLEPAHFAAMRWRIELNEAAYHQFQEARFQGDDTHSLNLIGFRGPANAMVAWFVHILWRLGPWVGAAIGGILFFVTINCGMDCSSDSMPFPLALDNASSSSQIVVLQRTVQTGESLELASYAASIISNSDRMDASQRLLDELGAAETPQRSRALQKLIGQVWAWNQTAETGQILQKGAEFMERGKFVEAEAYFAEAVFRDPHFFEGWFKLGQVHYLMGDHGSSLRELDLAIRLEPRHFGALSVRGLNLLQLGCYSEAAEVFREAQEVLPRVSARFLDGDIAWAEALQSGAKVPSQAASSGLNIPALGAPAARNLMYLPDSSCPQGGLPRSSIDAINGVSQKNENPYAFRLLQHSLEELYAAGDELSLRIPDRL